MVPSLETDLPSFIPIDTAMVAAVPRILTAPLYQPHTAFPTDPRRHRTIHIDIVSMWWRAQVSESCGGRSCLGCGDIAMA